MNAFNLTEEKELIPQVFVRISTSFFRTKRGIAFQRRFDFLMRKCVGHNFVLEDADMVGIDETFSRITNLHDAKDGVYKIITVNERRDYESGLIDDYDFLLVAQPEAKK